MLGNGGTTLSAEKTRSSHTHRSAHTNTHTDSLQRLGGLACHVTRGTQTCVWVCVCVYLAGEGREGAAAVGLSKDTSVGRTGARWRSSDPVVTKLLHLLSLL